MTRYLHVCYLIASVLCACAGFILLNEWLFLLALMLAAAADLRIMEDTARRD